MKRSLFLKSSFLIPSFLSTAFVPKVESSELKKNENLFFQENYKFNLFLFDSDEECEKESYFYMKHVYDKNIENWKNKFKISFIELKRNSKGLYYPEEKHKESCHFNLICKFLKDSEELQKIFVQDGIFYNEKPFLQINSMNLFSSCKEETLPLIKKFIDSGQFLIHFNGSQKRKYVELIS